MGANLRCSEGFKGEKYRATDGTIFVCTEGGGTKVEDATLEWGPNDVFVCRLGSATRTRPQIPCCSRCSDQPAGGSRHLARDRIKPG
jgi:gentisate 1,2-dioxygenase